MDLLQIICSVLLAISSIVLVIIVLAQHGKSAYLGGAIAGGAAETFLGKSKARTIDILLSRYTKIFAVIFIVLTVVVDLSAIIFKS